MSAWCVLSDLFHDDEPERVPISSAAELRAELAALAALAPRIAHLAFSDGSSLRIGIGGPWAGCALARRKPVEIEMAIAMTPAPCDRVEFRCGGQPSALTSRHLFPVATLIDLVVEYAQNGSFPQELSWET